MASFNKVILMGNLTRDPELKFTANQTAVCKFGIAVNRKWKDRDGNQKDEVAFVDLTAFGKQAEVINQYMTKGKGILVEGRLNFEQWTDKEGHKKSKLGVVVENFTFVGGRQEGSPDAQTSPQSGGNGFGRPETPSEMEAAMDASGLPF